jgi:hypothetical protein
LTRPDPGPAPRECHSHSVTLNRIQPRKS